MDGSGLDLSDRVTYLEHQIKVLEKAKDDLIDENFDLQVKTMNSFLRIFFLDGAWLMALSGDVARAGNGQRLSSKWNIMLTQTLFATSPRDHTHDL